MPCHLSPSTEVGWMKSSLITVRDPCADWAGFQYVTFRPHHGHSPALGRPPYTCPCRPQRPVVRRQLCGTSLTHRQKCSSTRGPSFTETVWGSACRSRLRRPQRWPVRQPQTRGPVFSPLPQSRGSPPSRRSSAQALVCLDSRPLKVSCRFRIARGSRWRQAALTHLGGALSSPVLSPLRGAVPR